MIEVTLRFDTPEQAIAALQRFAASEAPQPLPVVVAQGTPISSGHPVCPDHGEAKTKPSKKQEGGYYCTAKVGYGYCRWNHAA